MYFVCGGSSSEPRAARSRQPGRDRAKVLVLLRSGQRRGPRESSVARRAKVHRLGQIPFVGAEPCRPAFCPSFGTRSHDTCLVEDCKCRPMQKRPDALTPEWLFNREVNHQSLDTFSGVAHCVRCAGDKRAVVDVPRLERERTAAQIRPAGLGRLDVRRSDRELHMLAAGGRLEDGSPVVTCRRTGTRTVSPMTVHVPRAALRSIPYKVAADVQVEVVQLLRAGTDVRVLDAADELWTAWVGQYLTELSAGPGTCYALPPVSTCFSSPASLEVSVGPLLVLVPSHITGHLLLERAGLKPGLRM